MTSPAAQDGFDRRTLLSAVVVVLASVMSILDTTIVNVAPRAMAHDFKSSLDITQWVATGYTLAMAAIIPLTGWACDRFGSKRLYLWVITIFVAGSILSGAAWSMTSLIGFRVLQGLGGGMLMPAGLTILAQAAGPQRMGKIMGVIGVPLLLGPIAGPILGGWLVDDFSWRWAFFINLPLGLVTVALGRVVLPSNEPKRHARLDIRGLALLCPGLALFVFTLARIAGHGTLSDLPDDAGLALGLAMIVGFLLHARRIDHALIDVRLFAKRSVGAPALTMFLFCISFFGWALILPLYFLLARGESALHAGLLTAPQGVGAMVAMQVATRMSERHGPRIVVLASITFNVLALLALTQITATTPLWLIGVALFFSGCGMGGTMMPSMGAAMASLDRAAMPRASSGLNVLQRTGGSIGTALIAVCLHAQIAAHAPGVSMLGGSVGEALRPGLATAFGHTIFVAFLCSALALLATLWFPRASPIPPPIAERAAEAASEGAV